MKSKFYSKGIVFLLLFTGTFTGASAQTYLKDFESSVGSGIDTFHSGPSAGGQQIFDLTNALHVSLDISTNHGHGPSNRYLDNSAGPGPATLQSNSIKTEDGTVFSVKSMWVYVSSDPDGAFSYPPTADGTLTFTGKLNGVQVFSFTKSSGFPTTVTGSANGYSKIDFSTDPGSDRSTAAINEIEITLGGAFQYINIDDFTWSDNVVLPVTLLSYNASLLADNKVRLDWSTAAEINNKFFTIERSTNGKDFSLLGTVQGQGSFTGVSAYSYVDVSPEDGVNYYRLRQYDIDGKMHDNGVRTINIHSAGSDLSAYPNPVTTNNFVLNAGAVSNIGTTYKLVDISGHISATGTITQQKQTINVSGLPNGLFILQLSNGKMIKLIKR